MRKEFLKQYLLSLLVEGQFAEMLESPGSAPAKMAAKAVKLFSADLPEVLTEIGQVIAAQQGRPFTAAVIGKLNDIAKDVGKRGLKNVWADIQAQYKRGMEANANARTRR